MRIYFFGFFIPKWPKNQYRSTRHQDTRAGVVFRLVINPAVEKLMSGTQTLCAKCSDVYQCNTVSVRSTNKKKLNIYMIN